MDFGDQPSASVFSEDPNHQSSSPSPCARVETLVHLHARELFGFVFSFLLGVGESHMPLLLFFTVNRNPCCYSVWPCPEHKHCFLRQMTQGLFNNLLVFFCIADPNPSNTEAMAGPKPEHRVDRAAVEAAQLQLSPWTVSPCIPVGMAGQRSWAAGGSGDRSSAPPTQQHPAPGLRQTTSGNRL